MERPTQILGTDGIERCTECRGHVVQEGAEFVCTSCGKVVRQVEEEREKFHMEIHIRVPSQLSSHHLGSFVGNRADKDSNADFNGLCTVGFAKLISDNMGVDRAAWNCKATIRRVADRLSIPAFVRDNAMALSEKMLADSRENGHAGRRRTSVPTISAYALLSACRAAGMDHVGSRSIIQAHVDMGHRVTKSALLQMGLESKTPYRAADPAALLRTVLGGLESNEAVLKRLKKRGTEPGPYFRRLLQASQTALGSIRRAGEGRNPRTIAAVSVYLASLAIAPKVVTQREVAEIVGVAECTVRDFCGKAGKELGPLNAGPS